jgi:hypothetical protein
MPALVGRHFAAKVRLEPPNPYGYVFVLAEVDPASVAAGVDEVEEVRASPDRDSLSRRRATLHTQIRSLTIPLRALREVRSVAVFEAILFGPSIAAARSTGAEQARYDSLILIETASPAAAQSLLAGPDLDDLLVLIGNSSTVLKVFPVRNIKKIKDVDRDRGGVFLFNFFSADDTGNLLNAWDRTAQWWSSETAMRNSELMVPLQAQVSEYAMINNARWDDVGPAVKALRRPVDQEFVGFDVELTGVTTMPSLYRWVS